MNVQTDPTIIVRDLGRQEYVPLWRAMQAFTDARTESTTDEIWFTEHPPVFTLGQAGRREHIAGDTGAIPVLETDRGGQVTYHGPGQVIAYPLVDLRRKAIGVRRLVSALEQAVVALLEQYGVAAAARKDAPGVYVGGRKIAALGLRVKRGCSYHGLSLNVAMDLQPFSLIDPCGYPGLAVTQTADLGIAASVDEIEARLIDELVGQLGYNAVSITRFPPGELDPARNGTSS